MASPRVPMLQLSLALTHEEAGNGKRVTSGHPAVPAVGIRGYRGLLRITPLWKKVPEERFRLT